MTEPRDSGIDAGFNRLWAASVVSNLADGLGKTAIPLIATTVTHDPFLISVLAALSFLPWLLFGVLSGVVVDRSDRRYTMALANGVRLVAAVAVAIAAVTGGLSIWMLYAAALVIGIGETFYDNSVIAMVPSMVRPIGLERANGRMQTSDQIVQTFVATPIAGFLFAITVALPMIGTSAGYLVGAVLALSLPLVAGRALRTAPLTDVRPTVGGDIREVLSYLRHHELLRSVVVFTSVIGALNAFAQAGVVLYVLDTMHVPAAAFGLVTAGVGVGAVVGAITASRVVARFGRGRVMFASTLVSGLAIIGVGVFPIVWVAVPFYAVAAAAIATWNVPWGALRQQLTPGHLLGRMVGVIRTFTWGVMPAATLIGGLVARIDLRLPFIIGGALTALATLVWARVLLRIPDAADGADVGGAS